MDCCDQNYHLYARRRECIIQLQLLIIRWKSFLSLRDSMSLFTVKMCAVGLFSDFFCLRCLTKQFQFKIWLRNNFTVVLSSVSVSFTPLKILYDTSLTYLTIILQTEVFFKDAVCVRLHLIPFSENVSWQLHFPWLSGFLNQLLNIVDRYHLKYFWVQSFCNVSLKCHEKGLSGLVLQQFHQNIPDCWQCDNKHPMHLAFFILFFSTSYFSFWHFKHGTLILSSTFILRTCVSTSFVTKRECAISYKMYKNWNYRLCLFKLGL